VASGPWCKRATGVGSLETSKSTKEDLHPWHHEYRPPRPSVHRSTSFSSGGDVMGALEQIARLSARLTFQSVIEEVVFEELGRGRDERRGADGPVGYRNGFQPPRTITTTLSPVELRRPKLRHAHSAFCDQLFGVGVRGPTRSRPSSSRPGCAGCRTGMSRPCSRRSSATRRRSAARLRAASSSASGPSSTPGSEGSCRGHASTTSTWTAATWRCTRRPQPSPCSSPRASTPPTDPSSWASPRARASPKTPRSRSSPTGGCLCRSSSSPTAARASPRRSSVAFRPASTSAAPSTSPATADVKGDYWAIFNGIEGSGDEALAEGRRRARRFIAKWKPLSPAATACVEDNLTALLASLAFPAEHHRRTRHSNLLSVNRPERALRSQAA